MHFSKWSSQVSDISDMLHQECSDNLVSDALNLFFLVSSGTKNKNINRDSNSESKMNILNLSLTANKLSFQFSPLPFSSGLSPLSCSSSMPHCSLGKKKFQKNNKVFIYSLQLFCPCGHLSACLANVL